MVLRNKQLVEAVFSLNKRIKVLENFKILTRNNDVRDLVLVEEVSDFVHQNLDWMVWHFVDLPLSQIPYTLRDIIVLAFRALRGERSRAQVAFY
tara:strand:+ start:276 stop:557 length:282 start_codon:yes stop_codon:yes gene_type:complete